MNKILWAIFGNDEDSVIGDKRFNPEQKDTVWIRIKWWLRNPFHNFTHHVIGIYGEPFLSCQEYRRGNWTKMTRLLRGKEYPYWNYNNGEVEFYFGWRSSGAFSFPVIRKRGGSRPTV